MNVQNFTSSPLPSPPRHTNIQSTSKTIEEKSLESKKAHNKQRNMCVKKEYYQNISLSEITDNKKFWKTVSPLFGNKVKTNQKFNLIEKNVLVTSDAEIAKRFKEYFVEIVPKLKIIQNECYIWKTGNIEDPVKKASFKNRYHPSITNIKYIMRSKNISSFSFQPVLIDKVKDKIKTLNTKKACPDGHIPVKLIKWIKTSFQDWYFKISTNLCQWWIASLLKTSWSYSCL